MKRTLRRGLILGFLALATAFAAAAATMSSPLRSSVSPIKAAQLAAPGQEGLDFDAAGLTALRNAGSEELLIEDFPTAPGATGRLVLKRFEVAAPGARISLTGPDGDSFLPLPSVAHFSGRVDGDPDSTVYVGALPDRLVAYVHTSAGHSYVGPDESNVSYVVRMADSPLNATQTEASWSCAADQLPAALTATAQPSYPAAGLPDVAGFKQALVRIETDNQLYVHFGNSADNVGAYVLTLFGVINTVYEHDLDMHLTVSDVHLWTMADPYTGADTLTQLLQLGDWWHANRPIATYPRTYVHYLSGHPVSGGIAWVGVLCSGDFPTGPDYGGGYGLTQVYGTYPLQLWDQYASAHEMGHNFGSPHTHCYSPPIDQCYGSETPAPPCYSGMPHNPGTGNGTIMSYCHLLGWQYVSLVFHPRCITEKMLPEIASSSCLASIPTFPDVPNTDPFFHAIETIYELGITSGCTPPNFCPNDPVSRAQMAVFLLKSKFGSSHVPPPATGAVFSDVHPGDFAAAWIEELGNLSITAGCSPGVYCPNDTVTRDQMAIFLLRTKYGASHVPPAATGIFQDVPKANAYAKWIEELYNLGVTTGCQSSPKLYCPSMPNARGQMAVFLVKTFGLVW